uniref:AMP-dependent synthetase/ligase domain-containing protein n=1 Tax=Parascaris equorum TaxID=6256 RepID=A0A914RUP0_PAREQ
MGATNWDSLDLRNILCSSSTNEPQKLDVVDFKSSISNIVVYFVEKMKIHSTFVVIIPNAPLLSRRYGVLSFIYTSGTTGMPKAAVMKHFR